MERRMLLPEVYLTAVQTDKFKTACLSMNLLRPLSQEEASLNALLPDVLLRGTRSCPDINAISARLDTLYGASLDGMVRKRGEVQTVSFFADCLEDSLAGEAVLADLIAFMGEILLDPLLENDCFLQEFVEGEKLNLINTIESKMNDKRSWASSRLVQLMCAEEAFGVDRLGTTEAVESITAVSLTAHWKRILTHSRIEIFYMGSAGTDAVAAMFQAALRNLPRGIPDFTGTSVQKQAGPLREVIESMEVSQGKLVLGLRTGCSGADPEYPALIFLTTIFGSGISSKLFRNVREKLSLCYYATASLDRNKGIMLISSGIEPADYETAKRAILAELEACKNGDITDDELNKARQYLLSSYRSAMDSPGSLESWYTGRAIDGADRSLQEEAALLNAVSREEIIAAANRLQLDTVYFLKGEES